MENRPVYPTSHLQTRLHPRFRNFKHLLRNLLNLKGTLLQIRFVAHLHTLLQALFLSLRKNPFRLSLRKKARFTPCTKKKEKMSSVKRTQNANYPGVSEIVWEARWPGY